MIAIWKRPAPNGRRRGVMMSKQQAAKILSAGAWAVQDTATLQAARAALSGASPEPVGRAPVIDAGGAVIVPVAGLLVKGAAAAGYLRDFGITATAYEEIAAGIDAAAGRPVVLAVNSPGGAVQGLRALAGLLYERRQQIAGVAIDGQGTSAAYIIAAASGAPIVCDSADAVIGAVGVIMAEYIDAGQYSITDDKAPGKAGLNTPAGRDAGIALANELARPLYDAVQRGRGLDVAMLAGRAYTAEAAPAGLINHIGKIRIMAGDAAGAHTADAVVGAKQQGD